MKKFLKILLKVFLVLLGVALCLAAFYGYHWHRAQSLDSQEIGGGYFDHEAKFALEVFERSLKKYEGLSCGPLPEYLYYTSGASLDATPLEINSSVNILQGYDQKFALESRYEKYSSNKFPFNKKNGFVVASYRKENGTWFNDTKTIDIDDGDSTTVLRIDEYFKNESRIYKGKRKNGILTECVDCTLKGASCGDTISFYHDDVDSISGKIKKSYSKSLEYYFEGELTLKKQPFKDAEPSYDEYDYDDLNRLVEFRQNNKIFRFAHNTKDTANLDVVLYGSSGVKLGFYKRSRNKNKEVVRYGTRRFEIEETKYFKDGKLVESESEEYEFYDHYSYSMKKYDGQGNVVRDSSFEEETFLPGFRDGSGSNVTISSYQNGKIKSWKSRGYDNNRLLPFVLFPLKNDKNPVAIAGEEYAYDSQGRMVSDVYHGYGQSYAEQKIFSYDLAGKLPSQDYTTCWVSSRDLESLEWKDVSDLRSESADGKYSKELECSVVGNVLTCEKAVFKRVSYDYVNPYCGVCVTWDKCLNKVRRPLRKGEKRKSINDTLLSVPLSKDSMVYLDETMLESKIGLDSILCEGCEMRSEQDAFKDENGKVHRVELRLDLFTCKIDKSLYVFSNGLGKVLNDVTVSYGDTTGVPNCLVGFKPTNGITLDMTMNDADSLGLAFKKNKNEWVYFVEYPMSDGFSDDRTITLNFRNGKVYKYRYARNIEN